MTRSVKPVDDLIRFVIGPDGVVPDVKRKLPGAVCGSRPTRRRSRTPLRAMSSRAVSSVTSARRPNW